MSAGQVALPELECSVGVMAYNEEANIAHALDSILRQEVTREADQGSHRGGQRLPRAPEPSRS